MYFNYTCQLRTMLWQGSNSSISTALPAPDPAVAYGYIKMWPNMLVSVGARHADGRRGPGVLVSVGGQACW